MRRRARKGRCADSRWMVVSSRSAYWLMESSLIGVSCEREGIWKEEEEGWNYWSKTPPTLLPKPCSARTFPLASRANTSRRSARVSLHFSSE